MLPAGGRCPWRGPAEAGLLCRPPGTTAASPVTDSPGGAVGAADHPPNVVGVERVLTPKEGILPGAGIVLEYSWPQTPESLQQNSGTEESVRTEARGPADRALQWASHVNVKCF